MVHLDSLLECIEKMCQKMNAFGIKLLDLTLDLW